MRVVLPTKISQFFLILVTPLQKSPSTSFGSVALAKNFYAWHHHFVSASRLLFTTGSRSIG